MKNLSKEENLEQEILKMAEKCGDKKWSRVKKTFSAISIGLYLIAFFPFLNEIKNDISIDIIFAFLFAPPVAAGIIMFLSWAVLSYIITGALEDEKTIAKKMGELNAIKFSKYNAYELENTKEIENHLEDLRILLAPIVKVKEKLDLEDLKTLLKPIIKEYHFIKIKEKLNNDVWKNEKD